VSLLIGLHDRENLDLGEQRARLHSLLSDGAEHVDEACLACGSVMEIHQGGSRCTKGHEWGESRSDRSLHCACYSDAY
jgi:hypothetical protein